MSKLVHKRQRSPWLWNDVIYSLTPSGREHDKCLRILHDFTNKVLFLLYFLANGRPALSMTHCQLVPPLYFPQLCLSTVDARISAYLIFWLERGASIWGGPLLYRLEFQRPVVAKFAVLVRCHATFIEDIRTKSYININNKGTLICRIQNKRFYE